MIQARLNKIANAGLKVDGSWGKVTTAAVNKWRKSVGYKETSSMGQYALKKLLA